ncbi:CLCA1 [Branchiostoma lanceolatum]|uniref:RING-type E3 ubiquitin transferase n=1 Tax=Branchiostoma lanceolatum TaxID=7740 RepID=A0A8J9Z263_BRALA|nr:CLCA1 [Branchiostoma lanceolatum]
MAAMRWQLLLLSAIVWRSEAVFNRPYEIKLQNNEYTDVLVAIHRDILEDMRIVDRLKEILTEASEDLYVATNSRAFFKEVKILIPKTWTKKPEYLPAGTETFERANVRVDVPNPLYGDNPYVQQKGGCGEPGDFMHLTPKYVVDKKYGEDYWGPNGKTFVHEWGHLRWGLFDEYGIDDPASGQSYPHFYRTSLGGVRPTGCSAWVTGTNKHTATGSPCRLDPGTGVYESECRFYPDEQTNRATGSYMFMHFLSQVTSFCHSDPAGDPLSYHNREAPNKHNSLCQGQSAWDVMTKHPDFAHGANPPREVRSTTPGFVLLQESDFRVVLVLDASNSMRGEPLRRLNQVARRFIQGTVNFGSSVGLVTFARAESLEHPVISVDSQADRDSLAATVPTTTSGGTCIGCGLLKGVEALEAVGPPAGGVLLLVTDGRENKDPRIRDVIPELLRKRVIVATMASKMASDDFDEQFLTCPVCLLHFRDPRVLPCLHTFCKQCLQEWATKQQPLECPTCRTQVSLPDQGVNGLRTNFYVNNLLDFAAAKEGARPGVPCQVCEGNVEGSKSWCADCATLMCESCTLLHRKFPCSKDHEVTPEETLKEEEGMSNFHRKRHCDKHKKYELEFYCESCSALVCTACTVVDHRPGKDHNPVEISTVAREKKKTLQEVLQDIDHRLKEIQASVKEVEKKMSNLIPSKEAATDQAKAYFRQLVDLLRNREKEILSQIDEQCRADSKALQTKKEAIEFELAGLTSAQTFCQQAVEHGSDVHILEVGNQVQSRVESLLAKQLDLESDWSEFQFVENTTVTDFEKEVKHLGGVKTKVDVSKCNVVVKPAVEGFQCSAVLTTANKVGCPCVINSRAVTANMKDPSGTKVTAKLQKKSGGVWGMLYTPEVTGNHRLEIKVNSLHVAGSPFDVTVHGKKTPALTIGQKGSGVGELNRPIGVAVDKDGNIVVMDKMNKRVQLFDADTGQYLRSFPVDSENPFGVDVDSNGMFHVTSWGEKYGLRRYSVEGQLLNTYNPNWMHNPHGLAILQDGRMVVADITQASCLLLQPDGSLIREIGKGLLQRPYYVAVDESRHVLYVSDRSQKAPKIFVLTLDGSFKFDFGRQSDNDGRFQNLGGVALDPAGNIIVGNAGDGRVQVFRPDGTFVQNVGTVKGAYAGGVALTPDGYIAVACWNGHCIELYSQNADVTLESLAVQTGGPSFYAARRDSAALDNAFTATFEATAGGKAVKLLNEERTIGAGQTYTNHVYVDNSVGANTTFSFYWLGGSQPTVTMETPLGHVITEGSPMYDVTSDTITIEIPGTAAPGKWTYNVTNPGPDDHDVITIVTSNPQPDDDPIKVKAQVSAVSLDYSSSQPNALRIFASARKGYLPVTGAVVKVHIEKPPDGRVEELRLLDNGAATPARGQAPIPGPTAATSGLVQRGTAQALDQVVTLRDRNEESPWPSSNQSYRSTRPVLPIDSSPGSAGSFVRDPGSPCYWSGCSPEPDDGGAQSNPARGYFSAASETSADVTKNDGIYSRYFLGFTADGRYGVSVSVDNSAGGASGYIVIPPGAGRGAKPVDPDTGGSNVQLEPLEQFQRMTTGGVFEVQGVPSGGIPARDNLPPSRVVDLAVAGVSYADVSVTLRWTASGDDFDQGGPAHYVDLRYGRHLDQLADDFFGSTPVNQSQLMQGNLTSSPPPGHVQTVVIRVPERGDNVTFVFSLRMCDEQDNCGPPSNIVTSNLEYIPGPITVNNTVTWVIVGCVVGVVVLAAILVLLYSKVCRFKKEIKPAKSIHPDPAKDNPSYDPSV